MIRAGNGAREGPGYNQPAAGEDGLRMRVPKRLVELKQRVEPTVKTFEWTWTTAVVFCVGVWFFILIFAVVVPSFWMYFAEQKLGWAGPSGGGSWALEIRDAIALGLSTGPLVTIVVAAVIMQNWRKRIRGVSAERPTGGYR
jgi:hypothetical protein